MLAARPSRVNYFDLLVGRGPGVQHRIGLITPEAEDDELTDGERTVANAMDKVSENDSEAERTEAGES